MLTLLTLLMACDNPNEERVCNYMYAPSSLTLELNADWAGAIQVDVSGDDTLISCVLGEEESTAQCDDTSSRVELSGDLLVIELWEFTPDVVELTAMHDGGSEDLSIEPQYAIDEPNGEGCGERRLATESVSL